MVTRFEIDSQQAFICLDNIKLIEDQLTGSDYLVVNSGLNLGSDVIFNNVLLGPTDRPYDQLILLDCTKVYKDIYTATINSTKWYTNGIKPAHKPGVSLVSCCMDRNSNLKMCINTWLNIKGVDEIVIIDWNSKTHVAETLSHIQDGRVKIYRVSNVGFWSASRAKTFAYQMSQYDKILLIDADDIINDPEYVNRHKLTGRNFFCGSFYKDNPAIKTTTVVNYKRPTSNGMHLYGLHYVKREHLIAVHGQNQYINTYGSEDEELFIRLENIGLKREPIDVTNVSHIDCPNTERVSNQAFSNHKMVARINKKIFRKLLWQSTDSMCEYFCELIGGLVRCTQIYTPDNGVLLKNKLYLPLLRAGLIEYLIQEKCPDAVKYNTISDLIQYGKVHIVPDDFDKVFYSQFYNTDRPLEHWLERYNEQPIFINQKRMDSYLKRIAS